MDIGDYLAVFTPDSQDRPLRKHQQFQRPRHPEHPRSEAARHPRTKKTTQERYAEEFSVRLGLFEAIIDDLNSAGLSDNPDAKRCFRLILYFLFHISHYSNSELPEDSQKSCRNGIAAVQQTIPRQISTNYDKFEVPGETLIELFVRAWIPSVEYKENAAERAAHCIRKLQGTNTGKFLRANLGATCCIPAKLFLDFGPHGNSHFGSGRTSKLDHRQRRLVIVSSSAEAFQQSGPLSHLNNAALEVYHRRRTEFHGCEDTEMVSNKFFQAFERYQTDYDAGGYTSNTNKSANLRRANFSDIWRDAAKTDLDKPAGPFLFDHSGEIGIALDVRRGFSYEARCFKCRAMFSFDRIKGSFAAEYQHESFRSRAWKKHTCAEIGAHLQCLAAQGATQQ